MVVAPRRHVVAVADLDDDAAVELGPLLRLTARAAEAFCDRARVWFRSNDMD